MDDFMFYIYGLKIKMLLNRMDSKFWEKAEKFFPKAKDWPPENERVYLPPVKFVKEGTNPNGPTGLQAPPQEVTGRPDAYMDPDTD